MWDSRESTNVLFQPCPLTYKNFGPVLIEEVVIVEAAAVATCERPITLHSNRSTQVRVVTTEKLALWQFGSALHETHQRATIIRVVAQSAGVASGQCGAEGPHVTHAGEGVLRTIALTLVAPSAAERGQQTRLYGQSDLMVAVQPWHKRSPECWA